MLILYLSIVAMMTSTLSCCYKLFKWLLIASVLVCLVFLFYVNNVEDVEKRPKVIKILRQAFNVSDIVQISSEISDEEGSRDDESDESIFVLPLSDEILELQQRLNLTNPGHLGAAVVLPDNLPDDIQLKVNESYDNFKFNEFVSQLIPLDRELPDYRQDACKAAANTYSADLPKVSIVLAFYNEPFTMLMRTVYSILNRSPSELIEEILLIDDCSDKGFV